MAGAPILSRDESGRITRVTLSRGDFVEYRYNDQNQAVLEKTFFEGTIRDQEESMIYFAAQKSQRDYNSWLAGKNNLASLNHKKSASAPDQPNAVGRDSCNLSDTACIPNMDDFWGECARNPTCLGFMDDMNSFVGNLANWLGVGIGVGSTTFGGLSYLAGDAAAVILIEAGLGGLLVGGFVLAFGGGYLIGTGLNAGGEAIYSWVFTKEKQLIPLQDYFITN